MRPFTGKIKEFDAWILQFRESNHDQKKNARDNF